jgi:hypothetical protein
MPAAQILFGRGYVLNYPQKAASGKLPLLTGKNRGPASYPAAI